MITRNNLKEVLSDLSIEAIDKAMDANNDFIKLEVHIFNVGCHTTVEAVDYDMDEEEEVTGVGNIYTDKDNLLMLLSEVEHPYTKE